MRKVVLQMQMTFDGFIGDPHGDVDWAFRSFDDDFNTWTVDALWKASVHIMGGATGRGLAEYWPDPEIEEKDKAFADAMNQIPKVIFSKTIDFLDWNATRIFSGDLAEEIERLKREHDDGKYILAHGGARFAQSLSKLGLVDEYHLVVHPVVLGHGLRLFSELDEPLHLDLIEAKPFASGAVLHMYKKSAS